MKRTNVKEILKLAKEREKVVIVGAGEVGIYFALRLKKMGIEPYLFFDNNELKCGTLVEGVHVCKPEKLEGNCCYIISVLANAVVQALYVQLKILGIENDDIVALPDKTDICQYRKGLPTEEYQDEIDLLYYQWLGKLMDWDNPQTFNEKLNWEKANAFDSRKTKLADKYLVREYIKEKIGEDYLTHLYGVWDSTEEIDFDKLPNKFVLKLNNGSGRNIIVTDKTKINQKEICEQLEEWKKRNYGFEFMEMQYKDIVPKIICEEFLEGLGDDLYDYDIYCFHGEPKYICCIKGPHTEHCESLFYDVNWKKQPFGHGWPMGKGEMPKPEMLDEMLKLSSILAKDFKHVRIDWYQYPNSAKGFMFSEMTFSSWAGLNPFVPEQWDKIFGDLMGSIEAVI